MRIFEIEARDPSSDKDGALITILNMLRAKADSRQTGSKIPMGSLTQLMQNVGQTFSYQELQGMIERNPTLDNLVADYNEQFLTIQTNSTMDEPEDEIEPGNADTVKDMAKRATKRRE